MAENITYLIIGNGIAGITAAETLRAKNPAASIAIVADNPFPVYYRPALKDYLAGRIGEDKLGARPTNFYQANKILFVPERVIKIQAEQHQIILQSNKPLAYQKLLLANGANPLKLQCPGAQLQGVFTLRTIVDYRAVLQQLQIVRRVVVVGSGTLALETIETLRHKGLQVTHLVRHRSLWSEVLDSTASDLVLQQEKRDGVDVHLEEEIAQVTGTQGQVQTVITTKGTQINCEMVLVAIGVAPNIDFIRASGIACGRGVKVDAQMRCSAADIYAAGDVIETEDSYTGKKRIIGQWFPSVQQGRYAAYSMLQQLQPGEQYRTSTFYNASFLYGLNFAAVGLTNTQQQGYQEIVADPQPRSYRKVLLKEGIPVGMLALGDRTQVLAFKRAIDQRVNLQVVASRLFAEDFTLNAWLDQQGVPAAQLGTKRIADRLNRKAADINTLQPTEPVMEDIMLASQPHAETLEALLVHIPDGGPRLSETVISRSAAMTIGRQAGVHLLINEPSISRRHAEISYANGYYMLQDVGSSNGTFINEVRIEPARTYSLKPNDQLRFGNQSTFRFLLRTLLPGAGQRKPAASYAAPAGIERRKTADYRLQASSIQEEEYETISERSIRGQVFSEAARGQAVLNPDGSLQPPGSTKSVPPEVVATFKEIPALIILPKGKVYTPQVYLLEVGKRINIGREKGNEVELTDEVVSRRHAEILSGPEGFEGFYIRDLGSSNGVYVNQKKIKKPQRLSHGDQLMMGTTIILFIDLQAGQAPTAGLERLSPRSAPTPQVSNRGQPELVPARSPQGRATAQMTLCPRCGVANTRVARFCAGCSALLAQ